MSPALGKWFLLVGLLGCGGSVHHDSPNQQTSSLSLKTNSADPLALVKTASLNSEVDKRFLGESIHTYCHACHGVGPHRFVISDDPGEIAEYVKMTLNPREDEIWLTSIVKSLMWPADEIPDPSAERLPNKKYMPLGKKRYDLHRAQTEDSQSIRMRMIEIAEAYLLETSH